MSGLFEPKQVMVPGLPLMDAVNADVAVKAGQNKDTPAAPSDAALGFADEILAQSQRELKGSTSSLGTKIWNGLTFSPAGWVFGQMKESGTLTPEQGKVIDVERAQDAVSREERMTDRTAIRRALRELSPAQAAEQLGAPVAPTPAPSAAEVEAANQRDTGVLDQTRQKTDAALDAAEGKAPGVTQTWWLNAAQVAARSGAQMGLDAAKYPFLLWETSPMGALSRTVGGDGPSWGRDYINAVEKGLNAALPGDPARAKDFLTELSSGGGSFAGFLIAGYATGGIGAMTLGAAAQGSSMFEDAEEMGATELQKYTALLIGTGLGATEALPIDRMLMRADAASGGVVRRLLKNTAAGSMEEFIQEVGQQIGEDLSAKYLIGYDPEREIDAKTYLRQGAVAALLGGAGGAITTGVSASGAGSVPRAGGGDAAVLEQLQPQLDRMDAAQARLDTLLGRASTTATATAGAQVDTEAQTQVRDTLATLGIERLPEGLALPTVEQIDQALQAAGVAPDVRTALAPEQVAAVADALGLPTPGVAVEGAAEPVAFTPPEGLAQDVLDTFWLPDPERGMVLPTVEEVNQALRAAGVTATSVSDMTPEQVGAVADALDANAAPEAMIKAYHGSPHTFDRFDSTRIGTGEGAQAFGHGLYFAENEATAGYYRSKLSAPGVDMIVNGQNIGPVPPGHVVNDPAFIAAYRKAIPADIPDATKAVILRHVRAQDTNSVVDMAAARNAAKADVVKQYAPASYKSKMLADIDAGFDSIAGADVQFVRPGHVYEVSIDAEPEEFLDWDAPLNEQSAFVRDALENKMRHSNASRAYMAENPVASDFYRNLNDDPRVMQRALVSGGIKGIKYLDEGSRSSADGTRNFVVFDDSIIDIVSIDGKPVAAKDKDTARAEYIAARGDLEAQTAQNRGPYRAEQSRPQQGIADNAFAPDAGTASLAQIGQNLIDLMKLTVRQGRLTLRGAGVMGQYQRTTGVVRVKNRNDLSTLVHEAGHHLNDAKAAPLDDFIQNHQPQLTKAALTLYGGDLTDAPKQKVLREGFAEFFRVYVLNRAYADQNFGNLAADFETLLRSEDPTLHDGLQAVSDQYETFLTLPSLTVLRDQLVQHTASSGMKGTLEEMKSVGVRTWFNEYAGRLVKESVNRFQPLNKLVADAINIGEQKTGAVADIAAGDDPRILARLARNSGSRGMIQTVDGIVPYRSIHPATRGLREAFLLSQGLDADAQPRTIDKQREADFDTFLVALRAGAEYERYKAGKLARPPIDASIGDVKQTLADLQAKYGDSFIKAAEIVDEYGRALWRKQYDAGLLDKETFTKGLDKSFYAPLQRDMSDKKAALGDSILSNAKASKRFKGSDRRIISPMQVLMHKTFAVEQAIMRNDTIKALAKVGARTGAGSLIEKVPAHRIVGQTYSVTDAAKKLLDNPSIDPTEAADVMALIEGSYDPDAYIRLFQSEQALPLGENMLFYWEDGKLQAIQLPGPEARDLGKDVVTLLQGVGRETMPLATEIFAMTSTAFRASITSWPDFLIVNFIRDQMSAWILNDVGYVPFVSGVKGMIEEARQKGYARDYNAAMGVMGGMNTAAVHDARVNRDLNALRRRGYLAQMFGGKGFLGAAQGLAKVTELSETGTRVGLYEKAYRRSKADGLSDWDAALEASYTATDYIDFGLNGTRMTLARRVIPFLNAQMQGLYKMMRTLGGDEARQRKGLNFVLKAYFKNVNNLPLSRRERNAIVTGRRAWVKMSSLGIISAVLTALFSDDEDFQATSEYLRTTGWVVPVGDGRVAYIPKPFELAVVANIVERALESASGDREAMSRLMRGVAQSLAPPTTPPLLGALVEYKANRDFFTGRELVPYYMQSLDPRLQYDEYTSELAKGIGNVTGWSPMIVDHFLSSLGASAYRDITGAINALDPNRPDTNATDWFITRRFVRDVRRGSTQSQDFWKQASTVGGAMEGAYKSYKRYLDEGRDDTAADYLETLDPASAAFAVLHEHADVDAKRMHPLRRARDLLSVFSGMRRELVSPLGLERTDKNDPGTIALTGREKAELNLALSELASREMRNTLVLLGVSGWDDKTMLDTQTTVDIIRELSPAVADEFDRRVKKAKAYTFDFVAEAWPDLQDRAIAEGSDAVYDDLVAVGKALAITGAYD